MDNTIPKVRLCNLFGHENYPVDILVTPLSERMASHSPSDFPHRHEFYQVVLFTKGSGHHIIDFTTHKVAPKHVYYMQPGQVHTWVFGKETDGYLINFNETFFTTFCHDAHFLKAFTIFKKTRIQPVNTLSEAEYQPILSLFEKLLKEYQVDNPFRMEAMRAYMLEILVFLSRCHPEEEVSKKVSQNPILVAFEELIEAHYKTIKMPKGYAKLLHVTPNHLNSICSSTLGKPAGELIRDRILLEAKRLLVNSTNSISQVAYELKFEDNAYFSRFFKKYTGLTPDQFRKMHD